MLRYRVATLLLPFFLLAPALRGELHGFRWSYVAGVIALFASYVVATCLNDVFDLEVDRINHPAARDRPLVSGDATPLELLAIAAVVAVVALAAAFLIGWIGIAIVAVSLVLNAAYSAPPVRLCSRPLAAPPILAFAYSALPYGLGLAAAGVTPEAFDARAATCFVLLFTGRMLLKDFRDRAGDAAYGKRTFLLTYGKRATMFGVLGCIVLGNALLLTVLPSDWVLVAVIETYFAAIVFQLVRLWQAGDPESERLAIALGARMGNAVVLTLLGFVLLQTAGASASERTTFVLVLAAMFWLGFTYLASRPREAVSAYRG